MRKPQEQSSYTDILWWSSVAGKVPDEEFAGAYLNDSTVSLYFTGHLWREALDQSQEGLCMDVVWGRRSIMP